MTLLVPPPPCYFRSLWRLLNDFKSWDVVKTSRAKGQRGQISCFRIHTKKMSPAPWRQSLVIDTVQDFLIKLGIKPRLHILKISIFSQNHVIVRPTKIMINLLKDYKIVLSKSFFSIKNQQNLFDFFSVKNISLGDKLLKMNFFENFDFCRLCS